MFTNVQYAHCQAASMNAMQTTFRRAAEADLRKRTTALPKPLFAGVEANAATAPTQPDLLQPEVWGLSRAEWSRQLTRAAAAVASVLISAGLLGSVVLGMTSMESPADTTSARASSPACVVAAVKPACTERRLAS